MRVSTVGSPQKFTLSPAKPSNISTNHSYNNTPSKSDGLSMDQYYPVTPTSTKKLLSASKLNFSNLDDFKNFLQLYEDDPSLQEQGLEELLRVLDTKFLEETESKIIFLMQFENLSDLQKDIDNLKTLGNILLEPKFLKNIEKQLKEHCIDGVLLEQFEELLPSNIDKDSKSKELLKLLKGNALPLLQLMKGKNWQSVYAIIKKEETKIKNINQYLDLLTKKKDLAFYIDNQKTIDQINNKFKFIEILEFQDQKKLFNNSFIKNKIVTKIRQNFRILVTKISNVINQAKYLKIPDQIEGYEEAFHKTRSFINLAQLSDPISQIDMLKSAKNQQVDQLLEEIEKNLEEIKVNRSTLEEDITFVNLYLNFPEQKSIKEGIKNGFKSLFNFKSIDNYDYKCTKEDQQDYESAIKKPMTEQIILLKQYEQSLETIKREAHNIISDIDRRIDDINRDIEENENRIKEANEEFINQLMEIDVDPYNSLLDNKLLPKKIEHLEKHEPFPNHSNNSSSSYGSLSGGSGYNRYGFRISEESNYQSDEYNYNAKTSDSVVCYDEEYQEEEYEDYEAASLVKNKLQYLHMNMNMKMSVRPYPNIYKRIYNG